MHLQIYHEFIIDTSRHEHTTMTITAMFRSQSIARRSLLSPIDLRPQFSYPLTRPVPLSLPRIIDSYSFAQLRAMNVLAVQAHLLPFGQGATAYAVRFHIEAHCFSLNQLHGSAPVRCYLPYREHAVRVHVCVRVCLPFCLARLYACVYVQMNSEIRDLNLVIGTFG